MRNQGSSNSTTNHFVHAVQGLGEQRHNVNHLHLGACGSTLQAP